jgi:hypothetical protein
MVDAMHRQWSFPPPAAAFCAAIFCAVVILTVVKWASINFGPAGHEAIAAIQVAQLKILEAEYETERRGRTDVYGESISEARITLKHAWTHLALKQYLEAIAQAQQTTVKLQTIAD